MRILITGAKGLARALGDTYIDHEVTLVSRSSGFNIADINLWGQEFLEYDCVFNNAYDGFLQIGVLEFFYNHWKNNYNKKIITIGSRAITYKRTEVESGYWAYRLHKQALQQAHDAMLLDAKCDMKIINPGPIDTDMIKHLDTVKLDTGDLANKIKNIVSDSTLKRIDLWL
jgi:NAD(P)-dependent dehydrogenase (short-subunit alcohol dehydrogenase family)